ncbi:hypothetical protein NMD98_14040 [Enterococcus faecium]|uniref:hypothetical protein n=1 Tax=Enterococcus faecium TaxID=1352 RepID=UPI0012622C97|nr:hypothetical protein [Enterococcus faecium]KAB7560076.1 hypothetical protein GBM31_14300 [Enterococcus faecium]MBH0959541.1 hypothetical protein [Enterococcus faecium]MBX9091371.1 hypothetical protein [Enterococcus faecium]MBX9108186.1 hypothetical protein [Enterococcus faecium]MCX3921384.1 hypothetical protein [Enterococcus faecium]
MKLVLMKLGWYFLPIILFFVFAVLLLVFFSWILEKIDEVNLKRVVNALFFAILGVLIAITISSYRQDVPLSVGVKTEQIRVAQAEVKAEKAREEEKRLKKEALVAEIRAELDSGLQVASDEKMIGMGFGENKSEIITEEWLKKYRNLIADMPDKELSESYSNRFDSVEEHFLKVK